MLLGHRSLFHPRNEDLFVGTPELAAVILGYGFA